MKQPRILRARGSYERYGVCVRLWRARRHSLLALLFSCGTHTRNCTFQLSQLYHWINLGLCSPASHTNSLAKNSSTPLNIFLAMAARGARTAAGAKLLAVVAALSMLLLVPCIVSAQTVAATAGALWAGCGGVESVRGAGVRAAPALPPQSHTPTARANHTSTKQHRRVPRVVHGAAGEAAIGVGPGRLDGAPDKLPGRHRLGRQGDRHRRLGRHGRRLLRRPVGRHRQPAG